MNQTTSNNERRLPPVLREALDFIGATCRQFGMTALEKTLWKIEEYAGESSVLDVALLGRFKAGKSSLLNRIVGAEVLPVDVLPTTAVITRIVPDDHGQVFVHFSDGRSESAGLGDVRRFVTEEGNPGNHLGVERVDIHRIGRSGWEGVLWVDSPGIGSLHANETVATLEWLPKVGVAVLAVAVDQPLAEEDLDLLRRLEEHTPETILLLTKADRVTSQELERVLSYVRRQLRGRLKRPAAVLPVSIWPGYEGTLDAFRDALSREKTGGGGLRRILTFKVKQTLSTCRNYLGVALRSERAGVEARRELTRLIEIERRQISSAEDELALLSDVYGHRVSEAFQKALLSEMPGLLEGFRTDLRASMKAWRGDLRRECGEYRAWLENRLGSELVRVGCKHRDASKETTDEMVGSINRTVRAFGDRVSEKVKKALGIDYQGVRFESMPAVLETPSIKVERVFDSHLELAWFLIPMPVFRVWVHRHFLGSLPWELEKHLLRFAADWTEEAVSHMRKLTDEALQHMRDEMDSLQSLVDTKPDSIGDLETAIDRLEGFERRLETKERITD